MAFVPESHYLQLRQLVAEMPTLTGTKPLSGNEYRWLGRATQMVEESGDRTDASALRSCADNLSGVSRYANAQRILAIVHRALARAEGKAPAASRGAFVAVGAAFGALKAVGDILGQAQTSVLIVDAYMDSKALTDFATQASEGVTIRLLTDPFTTKAVAVAPAVERWRIQFGDKRPVEARMSAPRALHDRLIVVDSTSVWTLSQSLKDLAGPSPAFVQRLDPELATRKVDWYSHAWDDAEILA